MKQMTFAGTEYADKRKHTHRELFLIERDQIMHWKDFMPKLIFIFLLFTSSFSFAGAPPPGASPSVGRGTLHTEEIFFFIGAIVIFLAVGFFMESAWNSQNKKEDDQP